MNTSPYARSSEMQLYRDSGVDSLLALEAYPPSFPSPFPSIPWPLCFHPPLPTGHKVVCFTPMGAWGVLHRDPAGPGVARPRNAFRYFHFKFLPRCM